MSVAVQVHADSVTELISLLSNYVEATEKQDVSLADSVFHEKFRVLVVTPQGVREINRSHYIEALETNKVGGKVRTMAIESIDTFGAITQVRVTLTSSDTVFLDRLQILKDTTGWKIINSLTEVKPL